MHTTNVLQSLAAWVLWNSSGAAVLILLILAVRFVFGRAMSSRLRSNLWLLVIVRLMIPLLPAVSISLPAKLAPSAPHIGSDMTIGVAVIDDHMVAPVTATHPIAAAPSTSRNWTQILITAWLAGAAALLARLFISSVRLARATRRLPPVDNPEILALHRSCGELMRVANIPLLLASDIQSGPALVGVMRPKILLPRSIESQLTLDEIRLVLLHELAHLRRRDVLQKYVVALLTALHWFNPLLWIANSRIAADREFACDETVLRMTSRQNGRDYGRILLKLVEMLNSTRLPTGAVGVVDHTSLVQRRIDMIASYASRTDRHSAFVRSAAAALVLIAAVTTIRAQTRVSVTPDQSQDGTTTTKVYDVLSLLVEISEQVTTAELHEDGSPSTRPQAPDADERASRLRSWLSSTLENDAKVRLSAAEGMLTVTAKPETQRHVEHLLQQLAARRAVQTIVETRALSFPKFPELPPDLTDKIRLAIAPGGMPVEISEFELYQLIHALQLMPDSTVLTAPRVQLFDGHRAEIVVGSNKTYIPADKPRGNESPARVYHAGPGVTLKVGPSVDADHIHIALDLDFEYRQDAPAHDREPLHVKRTPSTSSGRTLLMNFQQGNRDDSRLNIFLVRPIIIDGKN